MLERDSEEFFDGALGGHIGEHRPDLIRSVSELGQRGPHFATNQRGPGLVTQINLGEIQSSGELDHELLRSALPHPRNAAQPVEVFLGDDPAQHIGRMNGENRECELGANPVGSDQNLEGVTFIARGKPVQRHRVFAYMEVRHEKRGTTGRELWQRADRHQAAVAHSPHLHEHLTRSSALEDRAAHRPDHRASRARAASTARSKPCTRPDSLPSVRSRIGADH